MTTNTFIDIGHSQVAYECVGTGPDVLFIHGWPLHSETWREIVGGLDGYRCHLIDLPGAGKSKATKDTPTTLTGYAESVGRVIDHLGLDRLSLVANNSGGVFARLAAAERPDQIASLVLSGSEIPDHHSWQFALFVMLANLPTGDNAPLKQLLGNGVLATSPLGLGGSFHDISNVSERFITMMGDFLSNDDTSESQLALVRDFDTDVIDSLRGVHRRLTMPTLLIWGEDDPFFPADEARRMAEQFGGPTTFESIPNAKLFVHEERPAEFVELTRQFLDEHTK